VTGSPDSRLVVLRGNSGSGKSTLHYCFDIPFEETVVRHGNRDWAHNVTADMMRDWYREHDVLDGVDQVVIGPESAQEETIARILDDLGERLVIGGDRAVPLEG
jgi:chloramphenicol 3-O-phosphotransferase